jgi:hypothetical protein
VRIVKWEFEGTPEELAQIPELRSGLGDAGASRPAASEPPASETALSPDIAAYVVRMSRSEQRTGLMIDMLRSLAAAGDGEFEIGRSSRTESGQNRYLMIYKRGPRYTGAVAYLQPSNAKINFRLGERHASGHDLARPRGRTGGYRVTVVVDSEAAVGEALELIDLALAEAAPGR